MKPPIPYFGGKTSIADRIVERFPDHGHYVEPFAGSLSVLLAKPRSAMETVNDIDAHLMTFWRVLRDRPTELARSCALTPHSRAEHAAARDLATDDDLELARRVWVLLTQGRAGTRRRTGWRYFQDRAGSSIGMPGYLAAFVDRMESVAERIAGVSLESLPALDLIEKYGRHDSVLLYVDPPYLATTRGWGNNYIHEYRTDAEHRDLAAALRDCTSAVVLSGYASDLYDRELYPDWDRVEISAFTGNAVGEMRRTEVLWSNRPLTRHVQQDLLTEVGA